MKDNSHAGDIHALLGPEAGRRWRLALELGPTLARVTTRPTVLARVGRSVGEMFAGRGVVVLRRDATSGWTAAWPERPVLPARELPHLPRLDEAGVWDTRAEPAAVPGAWAAAAAALDAPILVHVPLSATGLVVLGMGAGEGVGADEWPLLLTVARTAGRALGAVEDGAGRLRSALTDPATGLPNRLYLDLVLERYMAAARRGEPLSALLIQRATPGDAPASSPPARWADAIHEAVRESDVVGALEDGRFLVLLTRCGNGGGRHVVYRLRQRLGPERQFHAGIAEFGPGATSADALVAAAGEALRASQRRMVPG